MPRIKGISTALGFLVAIHSLIITQIAAATDAGKLDQLRQLAKLPSAVLDLKFEVTVRGDYSFNGQTLDGSNQRPAAQRISSLTPALNDDASEFERFVELGELYTLTGATNDAAAAVAKARSVLDRRIKAEDENPIWKCKLAWLVTDEAEGERLMESAVKAPQATWNCWNEYARFELMRALKTFNTPRATEAEREVARKRVELAARAFDKSVECVPPNGYAFAARAGFRMSRGQFDPTSTTAGSGLTFTPEVIKDLKRAARLLPQNPHAIATAAFVEAMLGFGESPRSEKAGKSLYELASPNLRITWDETFASLENLGTHSQSNVAMCALVSLGALRNSVDQSYAKAEEALRRAIAKNPKDEVPRHWLLLTLIQAGRLEDAERAAADCLKVSHTARNHIHLAKTQERLGRMTAVAQNVGEAQSHDPHDLLVRLSVFAVALRQNSNTQEELEKIGMFMMSLHADILRGGTPSQKIDFDFLHCIFLGLNKHNEKALRILRPLAEAYPDRPEIMAAIKAIEP